MRHEFTHHERVRDDEKYGQVRLTRHEPDRLGQALKRDDTTNGSAQQMGLREFVREKNGQCYVLRQQRISEMEASSHRVGRRIEFT